MVSPLQYFRVLYISALSLPHIMSHYSYHVNMLENSATIVKQIIIRPQPGIVLG